MLSTAHQFRDKTSAGNLLLLMSGSEEKDKETYTETEVPSHGRIHLIALHTNETISRQKENYASIP